MRSFFRAFTSIRKPLGHILRATVRSTHRSVALGLVLVAASSLTAVATSNTKPQITGLQVSQSSIDEGQTVTVTGTFTDPDPADLHVVRIDWKNGDPQKLVLPAGQRTFTATHKYTDNMSPAHVKWIWASVVDKDANPAPNDNTGDGNHTDAETVQLEVKNVAPTFSKNLSVEKPRGQANKVVVSGEIVDPGSDTFQVFVKWGDGTMSPLTQGDECSVNRQRFTCEHTYAKPSTGKGYQVELTVRDDDGGTGKAATVVQTP